MFLAIQVIRPTSDTERLIRMKAGQITECTDGNLKPIDIKFTSSLH